MLIFRPDWAARLPWNFIDRAAAAFRLDANLIAAVIQTESGGNTLAVRYEPNYRWVWDIDGVGVDDIAKRLNMDVSTMLAMQKTSWGLMQIMYAVALEAGYRDWPGGLLDPEEGILFGCMHLSTVVRRWGSDPATAYAAYNAGTPRKHADGGWVNQANVDRFLSFYKQLPKR